MAFLQNLIVTGSSKFLNKIYATDIEVSGTFGTSGNLSVGGTLNVTGTSTLTGSVTVTGTSTFNSKVTFKGDGIEISRATPYIDFHYNNSTSDYTSRIIEETSGTLTIKNNMKTTNATITTANVTTANIDSGNAINLNVTDKLRATHFDLQSVAQLGGAFYVSPTVKFPTDSNTTFTVAKNGSTLNITISDSALTSTTLAGVVWGANAKIKASGKIGTITTGTMDGTVTSLNTSNHTLVISVSGENSSSVTAGSYTSANIDNFCVMMYETSDGHPVGIMMNSYGTDGRTYIDIHGGTASATTPNVRIGNLGGLSFNDTTLSNQWGIYTNNGYYTGSIVANGGKIGGFTIGASAIYTGTLTSNSDNNIGLSSADFTRTIGGTSRTGLRFAIGDKVGITGDGILYAHSLQATGGKIGNWSIGSSTLGNYTSVTSGTASTQYGVILNTGTSSSTQVICAGSRSFDGTNYGSWTYRFYVRNDGYMFSTAGSIGNWGIASNALYHGTMGSESGVYLVPAGSSQSYAIGGSESINSWAITSGANFGVTTSGTVYCSDIHATGEITATSGHIGNATNGFTIDASGFYSGTKTANTSGYIAMSNTAFSRTINSTALNNLNLAIGSKFGVTSDGTLYANGLNIKNIDADNISIGTLSIERLTSLQIGGRNLLKDSEKLGSSWHKSNATVSEGVVTLDASKTSEVRIYQMPVDGYWTWQANQSYTLSIDAKASSNGLLFYFYAVGLSKTSATISLTTEWKRYTWTVIGTSVTDGASMSFYANGGQNGTIQFKNPQLELGNKATDWSPAPEDVDSAISSVKDIADTALSQGVEYIVGTQTATTASWTGVTTDSVLVAGKTIAYKLPQTSASNATLNLTLSTGATTGAKAVYYNTTRVSTQYPANSIIHMTYDGSYWRITNYNSDTVNRIRLQNTITAAEAITAGHIICGTSSGYRDIKANISFDLTYPLLYAATAKAKGGTSDNNFLSIDAINASSNGTITSGATKKTLYLKGTVNNNTFTISASPFMTTVIPTTEDGFIYIPLGIMYSASNIYFISSDKLYAYKDGGFKELSRGEASLAAKTATNYLYYDSTNGLVISSSASSQTYSGASTGYNTRLTNSALQIRNGTNVLASYGDTIVIGENGGSQQVIDNNSLNFNTPSGETKFTIKNEVIGHGFSQQKYIDLFDEDDYDNPPAYSNTDWTLNNTELANIIGSLVDRYQMTSSPLDYAIGATTSNCTMVMEVFGYALDSAGDNTPQYSLSENITFSIISLTNGQLTVKASESTGSDWTDFVTEFASLFPSGSNHHKLWANFTLNYPIADVQMTLGSRNPESTIGTRSVSIGSNNTASGTGSIAIGKDLVVTDDYSVAIGQLNLPLESANTGEHLPTAFAIGANGTTPFAVLKNGLIIMSQVNSGASPHLSYGKGSKTNVRIDFDVEYPNTPFIFLTLREDDIPTSAISDYAKVQVFLQQVDTTGFTATVINGGDHKHSFSFNWFAICLN